MYCFYVIKLRVNYSFMFRISHHSHGIDPVSDILRWKITIEFQKLNTFVCPKWKPSTVYSKLRKTSITSFLQEKLSHPTSLFEKSIFKTRWHFSLYWTLKNKMKSQSKLSKNNNFFMSAQHSFIKQYLHFFYDGSFETRAA